MWEDLSCYGCIHARGSKPDQPSLDYKGCRICIRNPYVDYNVEAVEIGGIFHSASGRYV